VFGEHSGSDSSWGVVERWASSITTTGGACVRPVSTASRVAGLAGRWRGGSGPGPKGGDDLVVDAADPTVGLAGR